MNKLIQELSDQADAFAEENVQYYRTAHDEYYPQFYEVSRKKFAELIIKECIVGLGNNYPPDDLLPIEEVTGFLKEHFGVE